MKPLRIVQAVECGGAGGTGNQVAALCGGLDPKRFEVHLAYAVRPGSSSEEYEKSARGAAGFHHIPELVREISPWSDLKALWKLFRLFRGLRPDIVHAHSSKAGFLARFAACLAGVPRIYYSPHGYGFQQTDRSACSRGLYRLLERLASLIGNVVAVSNSEAALARSLTGKEVFTARDAYLGPLSGGEPSSKKRRLTVCACGRMSCPRHPEAFVRLARRLSLGHGGLRFLWIGGGELEPLVRRMRHALGLEQTLELTGWLTHEEALKRLRAADIFVHYSRWEGLPNTVLEAMAQGLPVIASDIPPNRELVEPGRNGWLAGSEEELSERIVALAHDPELRTRMGAHGRALVREEYGLDRMLRELAGLYSSS